MRKLRDMLKYGADSVAPNFWLEIVADFIGIILLLINTTVSFVPLLFKRRASQGKE